MSLQVSMQDSIPLAHGPPWENLGLERSDPLWRSTPLSKLQQNPSTSDQKAWPSGKMDLFPGPHLFNIRHVLLHQRALLLWGAEGFQTMVSKEDAADEGGGEGLNRSLLDFPPLLYGKGGHSYVQCCIVSNGYSSPQLSCGWQLCSSSAGSARWK